MVECLAGGLFILFSACLVCASAEDHRYKLVRRFIWWLAGGLGIGMLTLMLTRGSVFGLPVSPGREKTWCILLDLFAFAVLQFLFFTKLYGRADAYAFVCCSIVLAAFGGSMVLFLMHMLVSVIFLGVIQMVRGNIGGDGNLKEPAPFVPYISVAFWTCIAGKILYLS